MTWQELVTSVSRGPIVLFSTATTGVHSNDELLALSWNRIDPEGTEEKGTIFHAVPAERALQGVDYHHITMHTLSTQGLDTPDFIRAIQDLLKDTTPFSYNPSFQLMALNEMSDCDIDWVFDLALTTNAALNHRMLSAEDLDGVVNPVQLMGLLARVSGNPPPFKRVMRMCDIVIDERTDVLPLVTNVQILRAFWKKLGELDLLTY